MILSFTTKIVLATLILLICVLVNVEFITFLERKVLGYSQRRLGPNKPSFIGLLQPMADAMPSKFYITSPKRGNTLR